MAELKTHLHIHPEVEEALAAKRAVVALESTIISHGMPFPQNVETAREVERIIRSKGAVPATIAILDGVIKVGLSDEDLDKLGRLGSKVIKCSRRDLAHVIAQKANGATTVSGTMIAAHMAGIRVFVTGGIGGVHREGHVTMDISADLTELGRTPVAVVCAGAKSLLDIPRTLEYLETMGVTVVGYGTEDFPAFFVPTSGSPTSCKLDTPRQCAQLIKSNGELQLGSGMLFACPVPRDKAAEGAKVERAIQKALHELKKRSIAGRDVTPFLLKRVNELTGGESLKSNIALIKNNAAIGAEIAVHLAHLSGGPEPPAPAPAASPVTSPASPAPVVIPQAKL